MKKSRYSACFVLSAVLLFASCSTSRNFLRQKYTDFGHRPHTHDTREMEVSTARSSPALPEPAAVTDSIPSQQVVAAEERSVQPASDSLPNAFPVNNPPPGEKSLEQVSTDEQSENSTSPKSTASAPIDGPMLIPALLIALFLSIVLIVLLLIGGGNEVVLSVLMIVCVLILLTLVVSAVWGVVRFLRDKNRPQQNMEE